MLKRQGYVGIYCVNRFSPRPAQTAPLLFYSVNGEPLGGKVLICTLPK